MIPRLLLPAILAILAGCHTPPPVPPPVASADPASPADPAAADPADPVTPAPPMTPTPLDAVRREPLLRIRIARAQASLRLDAPGGLVVADLAGRSRPATLPSPLHITRRGNHFVFQSPGAAPVGSTLPALLLTASGDSGGSGGGQGDLLRVGAVTYPGSIALHPTAPAADHFDVVNHVAMERYLPGVLKKEFYDSWHPEAFRAQAIAARSYAIVEAARATNRHFDLESTQASQAYVGAATHSVAAAAVAATRGLVLTHDGKVIPAYYSSACGGAGQDASPALAGAPDLPPLRGTNHGACCANARYYRWGPFTRTAADVATRMAAWGRAHRHPLAGLRGLRAIEVASRNAIGRPTAFAVTDTAGWRYPLNAEQFRFACNFAGAGAGPLADRLTLRSSHVSVRVAGAAVQFWDGRGFGHGVGLCQHGAQTLAAQGHPAPRILAFYYPGATLTQAY